jgi:signal transduction histidine kinase
MVKLSLTQWSRSASILGAVLLVVQIAFSFALGSDQGASNLYEIYNPFLYVIYNLLFDAALLLFVVGLAGAHARQVERFGWLGRAGLFLTLGAGALVTLSIVATLMVGLWPGLSVPLAFFMSMLAIFCLIASLGLMGIATVQAAALRDWAPSLHWRWVFLILAVGVIAALLSDALEKIMNTSILGLKGTHVLHVLLTIPAAAWAARRIGTSPVIYGLLVGLVSGIINQIYFHAINGTLRLYEAVVILSLSLGFGWLGGVIARSTLAEQETLYQVSRAIGAASSPQSIVDAIGENLTDPQVSHVALWHDVSEAEDGVLAELSLLAVWMPQVVRVWGPGVWRPGLRLDAAQVPVLSGLKQQSPLVIRMRKLPPSERAVWEHQGIRSVLLMPLGTSDSARIGLLMMASRRAYGFSGVKVRTYETIAGQVALALENSRLVEQAQQYGVLGERQRLSREIHDTLAQGFSSIVLNLEAAEDTLHSDPGALQHYLDQARSIARDSLAEARRLMWALRPESLERAPLPEALVRLAERCSLESGTAASATVNGTPYSLPPEVEVTLLRIAQEALSNCRKHAQADQTTITLSYMNNLVTLNVQDNGVGFDSAHPPRRDARDQNKGGFGLKGMRERVETLRGTLLIESASGEGTTLMAAIPVGAEGKQTLKGAESAKAAPSQREPT